MVVLPRPALGGDHTRPMDAAEVADREGVGALRLALLGLVDAEMPVRVLGPAVLLDEGVLLVGGGSRLGPVVALIADDLAVANEGAGVAQRRFIQFDCPDGTLSEPRGVGRGA